MWVKLREGKEVGRGEGVNVGGVRQREFFSLHPQILSSLLTDEFEACFKPCVSEACLLVVRDGYAQVHESTGVEAWAVFGDVQYVRDALLL
jgi:hypothetical protein